MLFFLSYPVICIVKSYSVSFQLVFQKNLSMCICISHVFVMGDELHIPLLSHVDPPPTYVDFSRPNGSALPLTLMIVPRI